MPKIRTTTIFIIYSLSTTQVSLFVCNEYMNLVLKDTDYKKTTQQKLGHVSYDCKKTSQQRVTEVRQTNYAFTTRNKFYSLYFLAASLIRYNTQIQNKKKLIQNFLKSCFIIRIKVQSNQNESTKFSAPYHLTNACIHTDENV